ncbi:MAG: potassium channel protein [Syntrophorhabdales bacterium]|jgi:voltage-gated potassium channel
MPSRTDTWNRPKRIALIIFAIILVGTVGYKIIGGPRTSILDALYMTAITITTVGYHDYVGAANTTAGKIFSVIYLFFSVGTIFYLFTALASYMVEGEARKVFRRRSMEKRIDKMKQHYIVCGIGMVGLYVVHELYETKRPQLAIDTDPGQFDLLNARNIDVPVLLGDATDNELLERAMIQEAKGLFATTNSDNDNIVIALTAKQLNPGIRVICRCNDTKNIDKIKRAGADSVVPLTYIGGLRMASAMIRPHATDFFESMLRDREQVLRVDEVAVPGASPYIGRDIGALELANIGNILLLAVRKDQGEWIYNPPASLRLEEGMHLIVLATPEERQLLQYALRRESDGASVLTRGKAE